MSPLIIRFEDGKVAGRTDLGLALRPVDEQFAYIFKYDEEGMAKTFAMTLQREYGPCFVTNTNNAHQGFVVGEGKWPGKCRECGVEFEGIRPCMTLCHDHWYAGVMRAADSGFTSLVAIVRAAGLRTEVLQTGGMVMCLAGYPTDQSIPYFMWGDPEEFEGASFGVYIQDEDTMHDLWVEVNEYAHLPAALARKDEWIAMAHDPNITETEFKP